MNVQALLTCLTIPVWIADADGIVRQVGRAPCPFAVGEMSFPAAFPNGKMGIVHRGAAQTGIPFFYKAWREEYLCIAYPCLREETATVKRGEDGLLHGLEEMGELLSELAVTPDCIEQTWLSAWTQAGSLRSFKGKARVLKTVTASTMEMLLHSLIESFGASGLSISYHVGKPLPSRMSVRSFLTQYLLLAALFLLWKRLGVSNAVMRLEETYGSVSFSLRVLLADEERREAERVISALGARLTVRKTMIRMHAAARQDELRILLCDATPAEEQRFRWDWLQADEGMEKKWADRLRMVIEMTGALDIWDALRDAEE